MKKNEIEFQDSSISIKRQPLLNRKQSQDRKDGLGKSSYRDDPLGQLKKSILEASAHQQFDQHPSLQELYDSLALMSLEQKCHQLLKSVQEQEVQEILAILDHFNTISPRPKLKNIYDQKQQTILHISCFKNLPTAVERILMYEKANSTIEEFNNWINLKNKDSFASVHFAAYAGSIETLEILKKYGADTKVKNQQGQNALSIAAQGDQVSAMVWLYLQGLSYTEQDEKGGTPLHWATYYGSEFAVQFLLSWLQKTKEGKKIINQQDTEGMTPLHLAAMTGNQRIAKKLLYKGSQKSLRDIKNQTPAQTALDNGYDIIYKILETNNCLMEFLNIRASYKPASISWSQICSFFLIYFYCMIGSVIFVYPFFDTDTWLQYLSIASFLIGLVFYFLTMYISPGYVEKNDDSRKLFSLLTQYEPWELCPECQIHKPLRSRHCEFCSRCVIVYDHHCPWLNNCIGAKNYPYFICFILTIFINLIHLIILNAIFLIHYYPANLNNPHYPWFNNVTNLKALDISKICVQSSILILCILFLFPLAYLIYVQMDNLFRNITTFEKYRQEEQTNVQGSKEKKSQQSIESTSSIKSQVQHNISCSNCIEMCCNNSKNTSFQI
ncbi:unnamed protein product (macronuclear) [Paramecium tetraurelia]|uniref:Palmitoyltransferase n=1 Tax=Paramecium tetraurelia TaxID=5888 RepID=A0BKN5_PARTE|nr:uncharacterized protein GSPATT00029733001 [Paramecium tetraurelia]CAK59102.1 unnamed protein product [Paramecium tetraurelia]|eukprot:XP_001426500.1 hypothetical protein (macronuclear) [Paramecium tetraurelia strain d4-2]